MFVVQRIALVAGLVGLGCSTSSGGTTYGNSGPTSDSTPGGDTGTSTDGGTPSCDEYCTTIMANCKDSNAQFGGKDQCMNSCKAYPVGTAADSSGNTLGCRVNHAHFAAMDPVTHCPHAGPGGAGTCGQDCDGYCQIAMMYCTAANMAQIYTDLTDCQNTCKAFPDTARFNVNDTALQEQKQVGCLLYHAQEASAAPADHCNGDLAKSDAGLSVTCAK